MGKDYKYLKKNTSALLPSLDIELTERCNCDCIHCCINLPENDSSAISKELSIDDIKEILKDAVSLDCLTVRLTGGEPLLREDFEELYFFARHLGLRVMLFTNATLISPKVAELFKRIPPLEKIEVSMYGLSQKSYEGVTRKPGAFSAAVQGINLLLKYEIPFVVKSAFLPPNRNEIDKMKKWANSLPWMKRQMLFPMHFNLRVRRDSDQKNSLIEKLRVPPHEVVKHRTKSKDYIKEMKNYISRFMGPQGSRLFTCRIGIKSGCVDAYGFFQPCLLCKHPKTSYDLKQGSLEKASKVFMPEILALEAKNKEYLERCAQCFLQGLCEQCPGRSWTEHGTLDTPVDYFCQVAHEEARYLGLLKDNERAWEVKEWQNRVKDFIGDKKI
jgi:MoaA/NifB/PqqE/SkfB family radical SAM enzyme